MINFLADHCLFGKTVRLLRENGYKVTTLKELKKENASDEEAIQIANSLDAVLISCDLDFGDIFAYPPQEYNGIIVLRMTSETESKTHKILIDFLKQTDREKLRKKLVVIDHRIYRIRS